MFERKEIAIKITGGEIVAEGIQCDGYSDMYITFRRDDGVEFELCCATHYEDEEVNSDSIKVIVWDDYPNTDHNSLVNSISVSQLNSIE